MMYRLLGDLLLDVHVPIGIGVETFFFRGGLPCWRTWARLTYAVTYLFRRLPHFWVSWFLLLLGRDGYHFFKDLEAGNDTTSALLGHC